MNTCIYLRAGLNNYDYRGETDNTRELAFICQRSKYTDRIRERQVGIPRVDSSTSLCVAAAYTSDKFIRCC